MTDPLAEVKPPPAAQPFFPHTLSGPPGLAQGLEAPPVSVNIDALCDLFDRSMSAVMYLDRTLNDADKKAVFDGHELIVEFDAVRGVDTLRHARPDELA